MLEFNNSMPIYLQICEYIKDMIFTEQLKPGDPAPSIRKLAVVINVNPNTVARSYLELERDGILVSSRGISSSVTTDLEKIKKLRMEKIHTSIEAVYQQLLKIGLTNQEIKEEFSKYAKDMEDKS